MRRGQKWHQHRQQGYGPGLMVNETSAERPQAAMDGVNVGSIQVWSPEVVAMVEAIPPEKAREAFELGAQMADPNACPKCSRILKARGKHLHVNRCKGADK